MLSNYISIKYKYLYQFSLTTIHKKNFGKYWTILDNVPVLKMNLFWIFLKNNVPPSNNDPLLNNVQSFWIIAHSYQSQIWPKIGIYWKTLPFKWIKAQRVCLGSVSWCNLVPPWSVHITWITTILNDFQDQ